MKMSRIANHNGQNVVVEWYHRKQKYLAINFGAFRISARVDICKASAIIGFSETQYAF